MNPLIKKHKKIIMGVGIGVVCLLLAGVRWLMSYAPSKSSKHKDAQEQMQSSMPSVTSFRCARGKFVDNLVMTGTLQGGAQVELKLDREGRISKVNVAVGDKVKKNDVIFELDTGEANLKLQQAEEELDQAVNLYKAGAINKPRLTQSRLAAELARKEYGRSFLRAPREGSIGELNAQAGEFISPQMTVATLVSVEKVFVEMGVIEKDLSKLHLNQNVNVEVEAYPGTVFLGKIATISPVVEGTSRTRAVRAEIPNPKAVLLPGMFAKCLVFIMEKPDTLVVPAEALKNVEGDKASVYLLAENGVIHAKTVETGHESADYVEILSGLEPDDLIVANPSGNLRDGVKVEVVEEKKYETKS